MAASQMNILIGCYESCMTEVMKVFLADFRQIIVQTSYEGVAREAGNGNFDLVIAIATVTATPITPQATRCNHFGK